MTQVQICELLTYMSWQAVIHLHSSEQISSVLDIETSVCGALLLQYNNHCVFKNPQKHNSAVAF